MYWFRSRSPAISLFIAARLLFSPYAQLSRGNLMSFLSSSILNQPQYCPSGIAGVCRKQAAHSEPSIILVLSGVICCISL
ncbi:hypothetical protein D3C73_1170420 [compost metagenome]